MEAERVSLMVTITLKVRGTKGRTERAGRGLRMGSRTVRMALEPWDSQQV